MNTLINAIKIWQNKEQTLLVKLEIRHRIAFVLSIAAVRIQVLILESSN